MRGGQAGHGLNLVTPRVREKGWGLGLMADSAGGFRGPRQPAESSVRALWNHSSARRRRTLSPQRAPRHQHPSLGAPPLARPRTPSARPPSAEGPARGEGQCKQIVSVCLGGGGGGSCLELCYVLKKKKSKKFGSQTTNCFALGVTGTNRHFLCGFWLRRPGLAGLGRERLELP